MREAQALLEKVTPLAEDYPARIEALTVAAFDLGTQIAELSDLAGTHEEQAASEASGESNEQKRKARKSELLREDSAYQEIRREIQAAERVRFCLAERAHRYAREFRLLVARESVRL